MRRLTGIALSPGIVLAPPFAVRRTELPPQRELSSETEAEEELGIFRAARAGLEAELYEQEASVRARLGDDEADLLEGFRSIVFDEEVTAAIESDIRSRRIDASAAVMRTARAMAEDFENLESAYMRERSSDIRELFSRLAVRCLGAPQDAARRPEGPHIVVAEGLGTAEVIEAESESALGFVVRELGPTSHCVILARAMGLPIVGGFGPAEILAEGASLLALDGGTGEIVVDPDSPTQGRFEAGAFAENEERKSLLALLDVPAETSQGERIRLYANIGLPEEAQTALAAGAEGIGLFRTEFLFMDESNPNPLDEERQYHIYKSVVERMNGRPVKIRTLDIGGDKPIPSLGISAEPNPFLGWRSIRYCLDNLPVFKVQLRALLRASRHGSLSIMFPMISSLDEVRRLKAVLSETVADLRAEGIFVPENVPVGIMVETPAAALIAADLAREVDFFSVGTNDLTQYTLAVDRTNPRVAKLYNPSHPAVSALMSMTLQAARRAGIEVGICGEIAGDPAHTAKLVDLGFRELSMSAASLLHVKKRILELPGV